MSSNENKHKWTFFKAGGFYQAKITDGADVENIGSLDKKLWAALSCPSRGLVFDEKTLAIIDSNSDNMIRSDEVVSAAQWTCKLLKDKDKLLCASPALPLDNIDDSTAEGAEILASAKQILADLGKADANEIAVADFSEPAKIFANTLFNADGIITEKSCEENSTLKTTVADIVNIEGGKSDRSGDKGIDSGDIAHFYAEATAYFQWLCKPDENSEILFLGANTQSAYEAFKAVEAKLDDFFLRAEILNFDIAAAQSVNAKAATFDSIMAAELTKDSQSLKSLPIAKVSSEKILDLNVGVNPVWLGAIKDFAKKCVTPILDERSSIDSDDWTEIKQRFAPYENWTVAKPSDNICKLAKERIAEIVKQNSAQELLELIEKDKALQPQIDNFNKVEKLVRLNANLVQLLNNFVNFGQFYKGDCNAVFQFGKLYLDQRLCELCVKVEDPAAHAAMAPLSYGYLVYCHCKRNGNADIDIVAVLTAGDSDNLIVGRHGVFYDRAGNDWDAIVTKIITNPISIRQAFFSPYKRFVQWISEQVAKRAADADTNAMKNLTDTATATATAAATAPAATATPAAQNTIGAKKIDVGTVAALGVAFGGITTAFGMLINAIFGLGYWLPLGLIGIVLAISLPSMVIAYMKLRSRNLAPLLDANGWAINGKALVGMKFGATLTKLARRPKGSRNCSL